MLREMHSYFGYKRELSLVTSEICMILLSLEESVRFFRDAVGFSLNFEVTFVCNVVLDDVCRLK